MPLPEHPSQGRPVLGQEARVRALIADAEQSSQARSALRSVGRVRLESPRGSGRTRQVVLIERPARLRLETLNWLGQTQSVLVTDRGRFNFYDGRDFEQGAVDASLLRERLGLDLELREAVNLLLAAPVLPTGEPTTVYEFASGLIAEYPGQRVRFAPDGTLLGIERLEADGALRWAAEFERWREVDGGRYPFVMRLQFSRTQVRVELALDQVELNPVLDPALFQLPPASERD
jgi:outer membrane biogenesis lipoprotein LolB